MRTCWAAFWLAVALYAGSEAYRVLAGSTLREVDTRETAQDLAQAFGPSSALPVLYSAPAMSHSPTSAPLSVICALDSARRVSPILWIKVGPFHGHAIVLEGGITKISMAVVNDLVLRNGRPALLVRQRCICRGGLIPLGKPPACTHPRELQPAPFKQCSRTRYLPAGPDACSRHSFSKPESIFPVTQQASVFGFQCTSEDQHPSYRAERDEGVRPLRAAEAADGTNLPAAQ